MRSFFTLELVIIMKEAALGAHRMSSSIYIHVLTPETCEYVTLHMAKGNYATKRWQMELWLLINSVYV